MENYFRLKERGYNEYFLFRTFNTKSNTLAHLLIDSTFGENTGCFMKDEKAISLAFSNRNQKFSPMKILTFNLPQDNVAYRAIFDSNNNIVKVFSATNENSWNTIGTMTNTLMKECLEHLMIAQQYIHKTNSEAKLIVGI